MAFLNFFSLILNHILSLICSPCSPGCPGVYFEDQAGPRPTQIRLPPSSTSWRVLELKHAPLPISLSGLVLVVVVDLGGGVVFLVFKTGFPCVSKPSCPSVSSLCGPG